MKKAYGIIIILAVAVVGFGAYFFGVKNSANIQPQTIIQGSPTSSAQVQIGGEQRTGTITQQVSTQSELTREDILATNWPFGTKELVKDTYHDYLIEIGTYDGYLIESHLGEVVVKENNGTGQIVYEKKISQEDVWGIVDLAFDSYTKKVYLLSTYSSEQFWTLYEDEMGSGKPKELASGESIVLRTLRFSPDHATLSFMSYKADKATNKIIKTYFHIIDLVESTKSIIFERPGNVEKYVHEHDFTPQQAITVENVIGAYRLVDNIVEFTTYYAEGTDRRGYTEISDKELWSYNRHTGEVVRISD